MIAGYRSYEVPSYVSYRSDVVVRTGALFGGDGIKPLREEPTYITRDDVMRYLLDLLHPLFLSFWQDSLHNLVWADPQGFESNAADAILQAFELDGCQDEAFSSIQAWNGETKCPILTGDLQSGERKAYEDSSDSLKAMNMANPIFKAKYLRNEARRLVNVARMIRETAKKRGIKSPPPEESALSDRADDLLFNRYESAFKRINSSYVVTADDFREVQGLDMDLQKARLEYKRLTGMEPSLALPSHVPGGESKGIGAIPWTPILIIAGLIAVSVLLGKMSSFATVFAKPSPVPSPARS